MILIIIFIPTLAHVPKSWDGVYEDIPAGFEQLGHSGTLAGVGACQLLHASLFCSSPTFVISSLAYLQTASLASSAVFLYFCSISFYNFFGLSVAGKVRLSHSSQLLGANAARASLFGYSVFLADDCWSHSPDF